MDFFHLEDMSAGGLGKINYVMEWEYDNNIFLIAFVITGGKINVGNVPLRKNK